MKNNYRNKESVIIFLMLIMFLVVASMSLGLIYDMDINYCLTNESINNASCNDNIVSDNSLSCHWKIDQTQNVSVTWFRNGTQNLTGNFSCNSGEECPIIGSFTIPKAQVYKSDIWMCIAVFDNGTDNETRNVSVTIDNTPPSIPKIYLSNGTEVSTTIIIAEENTIEFYADSSDKDGDNITYALDDETFCTMDTIAGDFSCHPTAESHLGLRNLRITVDDNTGTNSKTITINVTPSNDAPIFSPALTTQNLTEGQPFNYTIIGVDDENNIPLNLIFNITPLLDLEIVRISNTTFVIQLSGGRNATWGDAKNGPYNITISLNDTDNITNNSKITTELFQIVGVSFNHPPNISYTIYYNNSAQGEKLDIYVNATDIDNSELTFYTDNNTLYPVTYINATDYGNRVINSSFAYAYINVTNLSNDNIANRNFTLTVNDGENNTQIIKLNLTNINDPPIINEISNYTNINTAGNTNISDLTGYTGVLFQYKINASDPDSSTYDTANTGIGIYSSSDNTSFPIISDTGIITFIPAIVGNYTVNITVTDFNGSSYNRTANIEIILNNNPTFTIEPIIIYCNEYDSINWNYTCEYNIGANVTDSDNLDYISNFWINSTLFTINSTTGMINFSANQSMIGNHSIRLNVTDTRGGVNSTIIYLIINNTNNPPSIQTPYVQRNMVVGTTYQIRYNVTDFDLNLPSPYSYENLTFTLDITGPNISVFTLNKSLTNPSLATLTITPGSNYEGSYSINVTVTDNRSNTSSYKITPDLYIYNVTNPPTIVSIIPSGTPYNDTINNVTWMNTSNFTDMTTNITIYENNTYTFDQTSFADTNSYVNSLTYAWYYDEVLVDTASYYTKEFNFFSSGIHNLTFVANDTYGSTSSFNWIINVININRPPIYVPYSIENRTTDGSIELEAYLTNGLGRTRFYDPDDDPNGDGYNTDNSTNLTFTVTSCAYASFSFPQHHLKITALAVGLCKVRFRAEDIFGNQTALTEEIGINITNVTLSGTTEVPITAESAGGTSNNPQPIPIPEEVERPRPLQILTPKLVTTYKNATIKIPIVVHNTWNSTLFGITLEATTNSSNVTLYLDKVYIPKLEKDETVEATLYVQNYKSEGHYEIQLSANVTVPTYRDVATIYINSAELRSEGDELESKISFAQDLLSSNPECQELNELLNQAKKELAGANYAGTAKIVDNVLNGCKYLVNNAKKKEDMPSRDFIKTFEWKKAYGDYLILIAFGVLFLASLYYIVKKDKPEQDF